ncbi:MAG: TetR/AcrR family transcriptional regulator [Anaerolineales bacterium]|nr:TetR/AcrR family transcriptional regulator [Anaerolineales bacterium]
MADDRRIKRTRRALAAAIVELASTRPYDSISIREITEKADVGYATFFRHYDSKDDLLLELFDRVTQSMEDPAGGSGEDHFRNEGRLAFSQVKQNEAVFRSILQNHAFTRKLRKVLIEHINRGMRRHGVRQLHPEIPTEIMVHQMAVGVIGLFEWWLDQKMRTPIDTMARIYELTIMQAIRSG